MDKKQSGFLMLVVALLLVVIAGFATAFVVMMTSGANSTAGVTSATSAYDLALIGIENGNYQLLSSTCNSAWSSNISATGGEYKYKCVSYSATSPLSSALTATSTSIPVNSSANFATFGSITIDSETIYYNGVSGNTLLNAQRGQNGAAAAHSSGASVIQQQYIISAQGGSPSLSTPNGLVNLSQSAVLSNNNNSMYYAVGTPSGLIASLLSTVILNYNGTSWSSVLGNLSLLGSLTDIDVSSFNGTNGGVAIGYNTLSLVQMAYSLTGTSWSNYGFSLLLGTPSAVACNRGVDPTDCWIAVGTKLLHKGSVYSGASTNITAMSCAGNTCLAVGGTQVWIFSVSSTSPFTSPATLSGSGNFQDIRCLSASSCFFITSANYFWSFNPSSFAQSYTVLGSSLTALDCVIQSSGSSNVSCFIIGSGKAYNCTIQSSLSCSNGTSISSGGDTLDDIACNTSSDCLAIGHSSSNVSSAYRYNGSIWNKSSISVSGGSYTLNAVSGIGSSTSGVTPTVTLAQ